MSVCVRPKTGRHIGLARGRENFTRKELHQGLGMSSENNVPFGTYCKMTNLTCKTYRSCSSRRDNDISTQPSRYVQHIRHSVAHLVLWTMLLYTGVAEGSHLFRSSPGGDGVADAGLWGGAIEVADSGQAQDLYEIGFSELGTSSSMVGLDIISLSYDPISTSTILEVEQDSGTVLALVPVCDPDSGIRVLSDGARLTSSLNPYLIDSYCEWKCGWNAFAFYDSQVYFVLSAVFGDHVASLTREIQIRVLTCDSAADPEADYDILNCSRHLSTLHSQDYEWPVPTMDVWAGSALTIIRTEPGAALQLHIQLFNKTTNGVFMTLVQVALDGDQASQRYLHSTAVPSVYSGSWRARGLGEIAYRQGLLCWTAAEELYCGQLGPTGLTEVTRMIDASEAHDLGICTGEIYPLPLGRVLTGVAIASQANPVAVYFGCYSEQSGFGGLGLLTLSATHTGLHRNLLEVRSSGTKVFGGSLFLIDEINSECGRTEPTLPTNCTSNVTTTPCSCASNGGASHIEVFCLYVYLFIISISASEFCPVL